jgi:hypothetical protein
MKLNPQVFVLAAELLERDSSVRFSCNAICFTANANFMEPLNLPTMQGHKADHEEFYQFLMSPSGRRPVGVSDFEGPDGENDWDDSMVPIRIREHRVLALLLAAAVCESDAELDETGRLAWVS